MPGRSRPRRAQRAELSRHVRRAGAERALAWARASLVGVGAAWLVAVAAAAVLALVAGPAPAAWSLLVPSRQGVGPESLEVAGGGVVLLVAAVLLLPVACAAAGLVVTSRRAREPDDRTQPLSVWSLVALASAAALAPNLLATLALSATAPAASGALLVAQAWPAVAGPVVLGLCAERAWSSVTAARAAAAAAASDLRRDRG